MVSTPQSGAGNLVGANLVAASPVGGRRRRSTCRLFLVAVLACLSAGLAGADEFSLIQTSTVIGRNYGYPSGTPSSGLTQVGNFDIVLETAVFFKNLELVGRVPVNAGIEGETFTGFLLPLRARYRPAASVVVEFGALLGQNYGDLHTIDVADPLLRLGWLAANGLYVIGGTIFPTHWIHDAVYDDVQRLRFGAEQGLQLRADLSWFKHDTWVNWRVRESGNTAEEFMVGTTSEFRLFSDLLRLGGQVFWAHTGGQQNSTYRIEHNLIFLGNASLGYSLANDTRRVADLRAGVNLMSSLDEGRDLPVLRGDGHEFFGAIDAYPWNEVTRLRLNGSWFYGDEFLSRFGDPLYSLPDYNQIGVTALFELPSGLSFEIAFSAQTTDGDLNYTYHVNFSWGAGFGLSFLQPR